MGIRSCVFEVGTWSFGGWPYRGIAMASTLALAEAVALEDLGRDVNKGHLRIWHSWRARQHRDARKGEDRDVAHHVRRVRLAPVLIS